MCGVLGSINYELDPSILDILKHRGPDGSGSERFVLCGNVIYLYHRRLSILDLTLAGKQPMYSYDNSVCITFNGEIYNYQSLKKDIQGIPFNGHSDTETLINYISSFGIEKALEKLNGIFAFALLDVRENRLYLARDRFGVKPLYYYLDQRRLIFSSEIRPIQSIVNQRINKTNLMYALRLRYIPSPATVYDSIKKVEPGQLITFNLGKTISFEKKYFVPIPKKLGNRTGNLSKLVNEYGDLFEKAIERQLMSDVDVGVLLSGGIDSALVAAVAKNKSKRKIQTFTVGFEESYGGIDEIAFAKETAAVLGLEHYYKRISDREFFETIEKSSLIVEEPIGTTSIIPMYFLAKIATTKVKVVLSGQGADEPLAGYKKYNALGLLNVSRYLGVLNQFGKKLEFIYEENEYLRRLLTSMQQRDRFTSLWEFNAILSKKETLNMLKSELGSICLTSMEINEQKMKNIWRSRSPSYLCSKNLCLYNDLRTSLSDDLLMYTDKITMHFGLECRVPLLDNDLIEFIESLAFKYKLRGMRHKFIHKEFAKAYLPTSIIERKKIEFKSPAKIWFKRFDKEIEALLFNNIFMDVFKKEAIGELLSSHKKGNNREKIIFLLLSISSLLNNNQGTY